MAINKIPEDLPLSTKIAQLNSMILELNGFIQQGKFDVNELDHLYSVLPTDRKFLRNQDIGNSPSTYGGWSHIKQETGFSIWKYTPTNYTYNEVNKLYFDGKQIENRGQATSETVSTFDSVFLYNGDSGSGFSDYSFEATTETGTEFSLMDTDGDYLYVGDDAPFNGIKIEFHTRGSNYTLKVEYYDGASWTQMTANSNDLEENTNDFESDGTISWTIPGDWGTTTINSNTKYWVRISSTTDPITVAKAYYLIPTTSVVGLLALSSDQILNEEWAWCSYNSSIYVTIRNAGRGAYEGNFFITSTSTSTQKQNFFVYNHSFTADYEDSSYRAIRRITARETSLTDSDCVVLLDTGLNFVDVDLPTASGREGKRFIIKVLEISSGSQASVSAYPGETIDGAATYTFSTDYKCIEIVSDGDVWHIIGGK
jgi:hypothetical protein